MINLNWSNDERSVNPQKYLVDPNSSNESRWLAFTRGWTRFINHGGGEEKDGVSWWGTGMFCASILGDLPLEERRLVYKVLLAQLLTSERTAHWTEEQRERAMSLLEE